MPPRLSCSTFWNTKCFHWVTFFTKHLGWLCITNPQFFVSLCKSKLTWLKPICLSAISTHRFINSDGWCSRFLVVFLVTHITPCKVIVLAVSSLSAAINRLGNRPAACSQPDTPVGFTVWQFFNWNTSFRAKFVALRLTFWPEKRSIAVGYSKELAAPHLVSWM